MGSVGVWKSIDKRFYNLIFARNLQKRTKREASLLDRLEYAAIAAKRALPNIRHKRHISKNIKS